MESEGYYKAYLMPGITANKRYSSCYGFNLVVNAQAPKEKQEVLHHMYRYMMSDLVDCWRATAPFTLARKSGWTDHPEVKTLEHRRHHPVERHRDVPAAHAGLERAGRCMHNTMQKVLLDNRDPKQALDEAAAEVDRASADFKKS